MIIFSIAIPVYNVEKYLQPCLDSIFMQAADDMEILIVDDGSTDRSGMICDEYAGKYSCVHVLHQANQGVSAARNTLIRLARGKWIVFVDGDDILAPDAVQIMRNYADKENELIVFENCKFFDEFYPIQLSANLSDRWITGKEIVDFRIGILDETYKNPLFTSWNLRSPWAKMWNLHYLKSIAIRFHQELKFGEDMIFNFIAARNMKQVCLVHRCTYGYRNNRASVTLRFSEDAAAFCGKTIKTLQNEMDDHGEMRSDRLEKAFWKKSASYFETSLAMSVQHPDCPWNREERFSYLQKLCSTDWVRECAGYMVNTGTITTALRLAFDRKYNELVRYCYGKSLRYGVVRWLSRRKWGRKFVRIYAKNVAGKNFVRKIFRS